MNADHDGRTMAGDADINARSDAPSDLPGAGYSSDARTYDGAYDGINGGTSDRDSVPLGAELNAISADVKNWVGANPWAAIGMAFSAGWLACRISR